MQLGSALKTRDPRTGLLGQVGFVAYCPESHWLLVVPTFCSQVKPFSPLTYAN